MRVDVAIKSDSGDDTNLDQAMDSEHVSAGYDPTGVFIGVSFKAKNSKYEAAAAVRNDTHAFPIKPLLQIVDSWAKIGPGYSYGNSEVGSSRCVLLQAMWNDRVQARCNYRFRFYNNTKIGSFCSPCNSN